MIRRFILILTPITAFFPPSILFGCGGIQSMARLSGEGSEICAIGTIDKDSLYENNFEETLLLLAIERLAAEPEESAVFVFSDKRYCNECLERRNHAKKQTIPHQIPLRLTELMCAFAAEKNFKHGSVSFITIEQEPIYDTIDSFCHYVCNIQQMAIIARALKLPYENIEQLESLLQTNQHFRKAFFAEEGQFCKIAEQLLSTISNDIAYKKNRGSTYICTTKEYIDDIDRLISEARALIESAPEASRQLLIETIQKTY